MNHENIISNIDNIIADLERIKNQINDLPIQCQIIEKEKKGRFNVTTITHTTKKMSDKKGGKTKKNKTSKK
jgi:hypothetical protein